MDSEAAAVPADPAYPWSITVRPRVRGERATLIIADNGRGLAPDRPQGVGTRRVRGLAAQIGARLRVVSRRGVTYSLAFAAKAAEREPAETRS